MKIKLIDKYRNFSAPVKASFWFVFSNVLLRGISFITLPIFSRIMTTSEYGVVSVYHSWVTIITIFCTLTLWGGVFNIVLVKHSEEKEKYLSAFQGLSTSLTFIFLVLTFIFIKPFSKFSTMSPFLTGCMYLDILATIPFNLWSGLQRYEYKYKALVIISVLTSIINPLLGYFAVINTEYKAEARIITGVLINSLLGIFFFVYNLKKGRCFFNKNIWRFAISFNIVLVPHYLSMQILSQSDRLMINKLCSSSEAGIYSVAYTFAMLLTLITNGINSSFTPFVYKSLKNKEYNKLKNSTNILLFGISLVTILVMCLIPDVFRLMLPESYYPAIWVIPPVAGAVYFMFLYPLFGSVEFYYEEKKYVTIASIVGACINIVLNYIFIKIFGFIAAAYTTLFCYILFSLFHYFAMRLVLKKQNIKESIYDVKLIVLISLILLMCIIGITTMYNNNIVRWGAILLVLILFIIFRKKIIDYLKLLKK